MLRHLTSERDILITIAPNCTRLEPIKKCKNEWISIKKGEVAGSPMGSHLSLEGATSWGSYLPPPPLPPPFCINTPPVSIPLENHEEDPMFWTTLYLHVQSYESTNHCILIMESKSNKRKKIVLEIDIYLLTWNSQSNIHTAKEIKSIHASIREDKRIF